MNIRRESECRFEEYDGGGNLLASYVNGAAIDETLARMAGGHTLYYHADHLGSVVALTDAAGDLVEQYRYDAYGAPTVLDAAGAERSSQSSAFGNRFLFTGREWLAELGLYDYRRRAYSPFLGRFLQPDPIGFAAGDVNLYRYCANNPVNFVDPFGELAIEGYDYWMSVAESGHARADAGGAWDKTVGWSAAAGASIMISFIDFWDARGIQQQAELSGEYSATKDCEGKAWKHGLFAVGRIGLQGAKVATITRMARADFAHYPHKRGHKFPHIQFGEWRWEVPKVVIDIFKKKVKLGRWPF